MEQRKRGRPAKEDGMKAHPIHVYLPSEEAANMVRQAAELEGMGLSTWARTVLLKEARRVVDGK